MKDKRGRVLKLRQDYHPKEHSLDVRQLQINSLLEITEAINEDFSTHALLRMYEFVLRAQVGARRIAVFNGSGECVLCTGCEGKEHEILFPEELKNFHTACEIAEDDHPFLKSYNWVIPVQHKDDQPLYALIGGMRVDEHSTREEKLKFVRAMSNVVLSEIGRTAA